MSNQKMKRVLELARKIREMIQCTEGGCTLTDAIDAVAVVQASLLTGVRKQSKKSITSETLNNIKALVI